MLVSVTEEIRSSCAVSHKTLTDAPPDEIHECPLQSRRDWRFTP